VENALVKCDLSLHRPGSLERSQDQLFTREQDRELGGQGCHFVQCNEYDDEPPESDQFLPERNSELKASIQTVIDRSVGRNNSHKSDNLERDCRSRKEAKPGRSEAGDGGGARRLGDLG
jgi:hypothetical protein